MKIRPIERTASNSFTAGLQKIETIRLVGNSLGKEQQAGRFASQEMSSFICIAINVPSSITQPTVSPQSVLLVYGPGYHAWQQIICRDA